MSSSLTQPSHPQIQVGDLVVICASTILYTNKEADVGVVLAISPLFYNNPQTFHRDTFEPVRTDRIKVVRTNGAQTYEPANCLKIISKIKKNP